MKILGLQRSTLIDYPGQVASVVFIYGCNFRCGFCYNSDLVVGPSSKGFSEEEVLEFLKKRIGKLDAVCITGGEPLMTLDIEFVRKVKGLGYKVKIDTNGSFPEKLKELIDNNLVDYIAMDLKGSKRYYSRVAGVSVDLKKIEESVKMIHDFGNYEFRTTVVPGFHDAYRLRALGRWMKSICKGKPKILYLQGFQPKEKLLDMSFTSKNRVGEKALKELKECIKEYYQKVEVRA